MMKLVDGTKYKGRYNMNKPEGYGVKYWPNDGARYEGMWSKGRHHGKGRKSFADGTEYDGGWHYGKPHGKALLYYSDGRVMSLLMEHEKLVACDNIWASRDRYKSWVIQQKLKKEEKLAEQRNGGKKSSYVVTIAQIHPGRAG